MPCRNAIFDCAVETSPLIGFSSETPDVLTHTGLCWGPPTPVPLGWSFTGIGCFVAATSPVSKQTAETLAFQESVICREAQTESPTGQPGYFPPPGQADINPLPEDWLGGVPPII
jgi:hypothetical protein